MGLPFANQDLVDVSVASHYRYLSGILFAIGLLFWSTIPGIETNDLPNWTTGTMGGSWATSTGQAIAIGIEVRAR